MLDYSPLCMSKRTNTGPASDKGPMQIINIYVHNRGIRHGPPAVLARIAQGELVDPSLYYFRATPTFETGSPAYAWLNNLITVCSGARTRDAVLLDFYAVQ